MPNSKVNSAINKIVGEMKTYFHGKNPWKVKLGGQRICHENTTAFLRSKRDSLEDYKIGFVLAPNLDLKREWPAHMILTHSFVLHVSGDVAYDCADEHDKSQNAKCTKIYVPATRLM